VFGGEHNGPLEAQNTHSKRGSLIRLKIHFPQGDDRAMCVEDGSGVKPRPTRRFHSEEKTGAEGAQRKRRDNR
jgi:hypothetical protein